MIVLDLGSNLDRERSLRAALAALDREFGVVRRSSVWESPAYPPGSGQPNFYNLAVEIRSDLAPEALRERLRALEAALGRVRTEDKFAARTVDLDITLHPALPVDVPARDFVLVPLGELVPDFVHPEVGPLRDYAAPGVWRAEFQA